MSDTGYRRPKRLFFRIDGVDVNSPQDAPKSERRAARLKNMSVEVDGSLSPRVGHANLYGSSLVLAGQTPTHFVRRISDDATGKWCRVIGTGTHLVTELSSSAGTRNDIDSGYSGKPFTSAAWRPTESAKQHLYVADESRMRKVDIDGNDKQIGLPAPTSPPTVELDAPYWRELGDMETAGTWTNGGVAGAVSLVVGQRVNTTLEASTGVVYDSGTSGWGCFRPVSLTGIGVGSLVFLNSGLDFTLVRVQEVHREGSATTIASIIYESGTSGICTIQPSNGVLEFERNAVISLVNGGTTEYCRVLAVIEGVNGSRCIRVRTTNTWAATHTLQVVDSFRAYANAAIVSGAAVTQQAITSTATGSGTMTLSQTNALDLTLLTASGANEVPMSDNDYFTISGRASDLSKVTNIRVMFSIGDTTFNKYYYRTIEQNVLVAAAKNTQSTAEVKRRERQQRATTERTFTEMRPLMRDIADPISVVEIARDLERDPIPLSSVTPIGETGTGDDQWFEVRWRRGDCERVCTELALGWKDVAAIRIEITVTASIALSFNSLNASGGFEPNSGERGAPYQYRYRGRDSSTGVTSDYSPECLEKVYPYRDRVVVTMTQQASPEIDKLDVERFGGFQEGWLFVGTVANSATPSFTDTLSEEAAYANAPYSDQRSLQPWVRFDVPKSGTASIVAGNLVRDNGSNLLSTSLAPGTRITVNGVATAIRRMISTTTWELQDSIGSATNVAWEVPIQVLVGQPLRAIWRHDENSVPVLFACDGPYVRWSIGNNADGTRSKNYLELPEQTVMGFTYNGRCGVFTTERLWWLTGDPVGGYRADEVPNSKGLFSRYFLAVGKRIAWGTKDGINETGGGDPDDIVDLDLGPLFVNEEGGGAPTTVNGVKAPKIASTEEQYLRLDYADDGSLFFMYRDQSAAYGCLRYVPRRRSWVPYEYAIGLTFIHSEEGRGVRNLLAGSTNGKLHLVGGSAAPTTDDGTGFAWEVQTFSEDMGDARPEKRWGDLEIDADPDGATINVELGLENHTTTTNLGTITGASQTQALFDLSSGNGTRARNISLRLHGTTTTGTRPRLLSWEPSVRTYPEDTRLRAVSWQDCGYAGEKYMRGVSLHGDTYNLVKTLRVERDGGTEVETLAVQFNGEQRQTFLFDPPVRASLVRFATADTDMWTPIDWDWIYDKDTASTIDIWTDGGYAGDKYMQGVRIHADTYNAPITFDVQKDGGTVVDTITITHNGERNEPYSFDTTSDALRVARLIRLVKTSGGTWSLLSPLKWDYNREPPAAQWWEIQYTGAESRDYFHVFQIMLALASSATVTMKTYVDDGTLLATNTIASTSGVMDRTSPIVLPARKTKLAKWRFESTAPFRLYQRDCSIWVMPYAGSDYSILKPFGDVHRDRGAEI